MTVSQRWQGGRTSYKPPGPPFVPAIHEVAFIDRTAARRFTLEHHYADTVPAWVYSVGLWRRGALVGVAMFSQPAAQAVLDILPDGRESGTELGRLVLTPEVETNGETWFIKRAFALAHRHGYEHVMSYADPLERTTSDGTLVKPGHVGLIYQAHNGIYTGRGRGRPLWLLPSGQVLNERSISKSKAGHRGASTAIGKLVQFGAPRPGDGDDVAAWVAEWVPRLCRRVSHPGNYRYVWPLGGDSRARRALVRHLAERGIPDNLERPRAVEAA